MASDIIQSLEVKELIQRGAIISISAVDFIVGATGGWTKNNDGGIATLPASQTASTMIVPITIKNGATIVGFHIHGQLDAAGNTATLDASIREVTPVVTGCTNTSLGAITQVSKIADYLLNETHTLAIPTKTTNGKSHYMLITGTTAAATDLEINSIDIVYDSI
ncbi:hypothetical protein GQ473_00195 [archaeon]|nr:hypothetical protein [archaeon]